MTGMPAPEGGDHRRASRQPESDPALEALLEFLRRARGFDFTGYKRSSLERRVRRRMEHVSCSAFADYLDYLEVHPDEYEELFNTILINVTEFFRDPPAWEHLQRDALPALLAEKPDDEPVRVWSAGCATGQEALTIAMVLAESLGEEAFRERVKIYATDIDEEALVVARQATYAERDLERLPSQLAERYFVAQGHSFAFRPDLRRALIFGRNNLVSDAPISRLDLLVCRNTLMYLTAETQHRILRHFHFALRDGGVLMLGRSEMMTAHRELFAASDMKARIFRKRPHVAELRTRVAAMVEPPDDGGPPSGDDLLAREAALELAPQAQVIVSDSGALRFANMTARTMFGLGARELARPLTDVRLGADAAALTRALAEALTERRRIQLGEVTFTPPDGGPRRLAVEVVPLVASTGTPIGASVHFDDVTRYAGMQDELERSRHDLEAAHEELESTIDELETTNEELQSANEELQTTNEELQLTNEELETMNEELQSTNEELETINDELRERTGELNRVNDFLEVILTSLGVAVAVVDRGGRVQVWNHGSEDLWGLSADDAVGEHFLTLDIGLEPARLAESLRAVIGHGSRQAASVEAVNRRGRPIHVQVTMLPLVAPDTNGADVRGAIVLMEDKLAETEAEAAPGPDHGGAAG